MLSCSSHVWPCCSSPPSSSVHGVIPGKNTGVDCHALLQGIFPTQGLNPCLLHFLHWQARCLPLVHLGSLGYNPQGHKELDTTGYSTAKKKKKKVISGVTHGCMCVGVGIPVTYSCARETFKKLWTSLKGLRHQFLCCTALYHLIPEEW